MRKKSVYFEKDSSHNNDYGTYLNKVKAAEIEKMDIPQKVLNIYQKRFNQSWAVKRTKEQYELYLELIKKEKNKEYTSSPIEITPLASNVNSQSCEYDLGSN